MDPEELEWMTEGEEPSGKNAVLFELQQLLHGRPQRELEEMARILRSPAPPHGMRP